MTLATAAGSAVAAWPLDETSGNAIELVNGYTGIDSNTVGSGTGLLHALARDFERDNSESFSVADNANLSLGDTDWSIAVWVKLESLVTYQIAGKAVATGPEWVIAYAAGGTNRFTFRVWPADGGTGETIVTDGGGFGAGNAPSTGSWYLIVVWHDATNNQIGIATSANSLTAYTVAHTGGMWDSTGSTYIGQNGPFFAQYYDGLMNEMVILKNYILSGTEITELYNSGTGVPFASWASVAAPPKVVFCKNTNQLIKGI